MKIDALSAAGKMPKKRIVLENINKDNIDIYNILENLTNTHDLDLFISKMESSQIDNTSNVYSIKAKKMLKSFPVEVEAKHVFKTDCNVQKSEFSDKLAASINILMNKLYDKCSSILSAVDKMANKPILESGKNIINSAKK